MCARKIYRDQLDEADGFADKLPLETFEDVLLRLSGVKLGVHIIYFLEDSKQSVFMCQHIFVKSSLASMHVQWR